MIKKISFLITVLLLVFNCKSHKTDIRKDKFHKSYEFLLKEYGKDKIVVSDSVFNMDISNFYDVLKQDSTMQPIKFFDSLNAIDEETKFESFTHIDLLNLSRNTVNSESDICLFFSKPKKNFLIAEIFKIEKGESTYYSDLTFFGSSEVFLFYFEGNEIKKHYQITLDYN